MQMFVVVCVVLHGLCSPGEGFRIHFLSGAAYWVYPPPTDGRVVVGGWTYSLISLNHGVVVGSGCALEGLYLV